MLNRIVIAGRLTRDPELRRTASGVSVASFTIACDDSFNRGQNGEKTTVFMAVSCFRATAENVAKFTRKGSLVAVYGRLTQRKYVNRDNVQVTVTEISADGVEFLEPKSAANAAAGFVPDGQPAPEADEPAAADSIDIIEDDLPF